MPAEYSPQWSLFEVYARGLTNFPRNTHSSFLAAFPILVREPVSLFLIGPLTWHKMNCIHYRLAHDVFMTANGYVSTVLSGAEVASPQTSFEVRLSGEMNAWQTNPKDVCGETSAEVVCSYTVTRWSPTDRTSPNTGSTPDVSRQNIFFSLRLSTSKLSKKLLCTSHKN